MSAVGLLREEATGLKSGQTDRRTGEQEDGGAFEAILLKICMICVLHLLLCICFDVEM